MILRIFIALFTAQVWSLPQSQACTLEDSAIIHRIQSTDVLVEATVLSTVKDTLGAYIVPREATLSVQRALVGGPLSEVIHMELDSTLTEFSSCLDLYQGYEEGDHFLVFLSRKKDLDVFWAAPHVQPWVVDYDPVDPSILARYIEQTVAQEVEPIAFSFEGPDTVGAGAQFRSRLTITNRFDETLRVRIPAERTLETSFEFTFLIQNPDGDRFPADHPILVTIKPGETKTVELDDAFEKVPEGHFKYEGTLWLPGNKDHSIAYHNRLFSRWMSALPTSVEPSSWGNVKHSYSSSP